MAQPDNMGVTDNARLLLGFLSGKFSHGDHYHIQEVNASAGTAVIENDMTENTYLVSVIQIGGVE